MRPGTMTSLLLTLFVTSPLAAQGTWPVQPGARVRITTRDGVLRGQVGTLLALRDDTLLLRVEERADTIAFATTQIGHMDVSKGRRGHALVGGGIGLLSGVTIGAIAAATAGSGTCVHPDDTLGCAVGMGVVDAYKVALPIVGGLGGALVGTIVGVLVRTDRWVALPGVGRQAGLQGTPLPKGVTGLGLVLRF